MTDNLKPRVLITGVTGFLGHNVLNEFVMGEGAGQFRVRATVRDKDNIKKMKMLRSLLGENYDQVEFVNAELESEESLFNAAKDCQYIVHTASPVITTVSLDLDKMVKPAVNGIDYVMKAARAHGIKRVVMTSSVAAIKYCP